MKNIIEVFGLQRSGTNFLQWTLKNNFKNLNYINYTEHTSGVLGDIQGMAKYQQPQSIKHLTPTLDYSQFIIGIYKPLPKWVESSFRTNHLRDISKAELIHTNWLNDFKALDPNRTILFEHSYITQNYNECLSLIAEKFNVELIEKIIQPSYRFDRENRQTSIPFKL